MESRRRASYDAIVAGGGLIGLACAWRAAQRGLSLLVLEREEPGCGASGVAAGMLAPVTEADFGEQRLLRLNLESRGLWAGFAAELEESSGLPTGYAETGALVVAADRDDVEELRRLHDFQRSLGLDAAWLAPSGCRALEPGLSPRVAGGIDAPHDAQVDPRAVTRALRAALAEAGCEVLSGVEVTGLEAERDRVTGVRTATGPINADAVVVAAGAWSGGDAFDGAGDCPPVRPVKGQLLELRTRSSSPPLAARIVRTPRCYIVNRPDGRVVVGATVEEQGFDDAVTADGVYRLLEAAWEVLPDVGELELAAARAGLRPGTPDNAPAIGWSAREGLLFACGHHRNGVLQAPLTARAVADMLSGREPPESVAGFGPQRFDRARAGRA